MANKVLISNEQNAVKVPSGLRILIRRSCNAVLNYEKFDGPAEISVTFVDNDRIHELNKQYRNKDSATDVLSFPMGENGVYDIDEDNGCKVLGDIVIGHNSTIGSSCWIKTSVPAGTRVLNKDPDVVMIRKA